MNFKKIVAVMLAAMLLIVSGGISAFAEAEVLTEDVIADVDFEEESMEEEAELFAEEEPAEVTAINVATLDELLAVEDGSSVNITSDITAAGEFTTDKAITISGGKLIFDGATVNAPELSGAVYAAADTTININAPKATLYATGDLEFLGTNNLDMVSFGYYNRTFTIGKGASLNILKTEPAGESRISVAYGNTFNITGDIENAKTADKDTLIPSLSVKGGISVTGGSGATFNAENAYIKIGNASNSGFSSKNKTANGAFNFNFNNCYFENDGNLVFAEPTNGMNPTFNFSAKDSCFYIGAYLKFEAPGCETIFDNTVVSSKVLRNAGDISIKNDSDISTREHTHNHGGNKGSITVDNATLSIIPTAKNNPFDVYNDDTTGTLIIKNGAVANVDYTKDSAITVSGDSKLVGKDVIDSTLTLDATNGIAGGSAINLSDAGNLSEVVTVTGLPEGVEHTFGDDGTVKIEVEAMLTNTAGDVKYYKTFKEAALAVEEGDTVTLLSDVTLNDWHGTHGKSWNDGSGTFNAAITFDGNGKTLKFTGDLKDGNGPEAFRIIADTTVKNLTMDLSEVTTGGKIYAIHAGACNLTVDNCTFIGKGTGRGILFGSKKVDISEYEIAVKNSTFKDWGYGLCDNEEGTSLKSVKVEECSFTNGGAKLSAIENVTFKKIQWITHGFVQQIMALKTFSMLL